MSPAQARDEARKVLGDVAPGIDPAAERAAERQRDLKERAEHTFESFICTEYRPWGKAHLRDYTLAEGRLKSCFGDLYPKKLDQITQWLVEKWRSERLRGGISLLTATWPSCVRRLTRPCSGASWMSTPPMSKTDFVSI
jgi:hypothetical protein